ncbi:phage baseplate assembly protein V [Vreelandella subterranea]|uniref:Phage baseplate assembly protein V n=1 Tax=Vreelandella subterranea TaxID=416874 RepID=A0A1H9S3N4_9GAMM|nr:phage baseplate assembly protein V [Halomonas subterranea]SER78963.1 phage baseplate assembly protein V [Halomonas subterranea]
MVGRETTKLLSPVWRRLRLLISRAVVTRTDSAKGLQILQLVLLRDETREVEHMEPYGFTARPLQGAEAVAAAVGGARGHLVALVATDRRYRKKGLAKGEVALYTDEGDELVFNRGRIVRLNAGSAVEVTAPQVTITASTSITLDTPDVFATGNIKAQGDISDGTGSMQRMRDTYNDHDHDENDSAGPTDAPNQEMS